MFTKILPAFLWKLLHITHFSRVSLRNSSRDSRTFSKDDSRNLLMQISTAISPWILSENLLGIVKKYSNKYSSSNSFRKSAIQKFFRSCSKFFFRKLASYSFRNSSKVSSPKYSFMNSLRKSLRQSLRNFL